MHVHILGICGTFMGGVALLARALGHTVSGQDTNTYPPMSDQLSAQGIALSEGWEPADIPNESDVIIIGNALSRGVPAVEYVLNSGLHYTSGAQWLSEQILRGRWVVAVAGTHGKTTTAAMVAWILEEAGMAPGFLIGGIPRDFGISARMGETDFFVIEADEYDTAFFDKRSKFVHYRPRTLITTNLEYDHADIFPDLAAIQRQFHHLIRTIPASGLIVAPAADTHLQTVFAQGCWTPQEHFGMDEEKGWGARLLDTDGCRFEVLWWGEPQGMVKWSLGGIHNINNALAAISATHHVGVTVKQAVTSLGRFRNVKRRLEVRGKVRGVTLYDDFAHHPTAIHTTLDGLRRRVQNGRIIAVLEPRSNTMRMGVHRDTLATSLQLADRAHILQPSALEWDLVAAVASSSHIIVHPSIDAIVAAVLAEVAAGDHVVVMSNGGFGGIHGRLLAELGHI